MVSAFIRIRGERLGFGQERNKYHLIVIPVSCYQVAYDDGQLISSSLLYAADAHNTISKHASGVDLHLFAILQLDDLLVLHCLVFQHSIELLHDHE